jgi:FKBP-type peptidyl-prolyl cis-trans isomerase 2
MNTAKNTDTIRVHYTGRLGDGAIFDSSLEREPLEFTIGSGQLISGFDEGVIGMKINEKRTLTIPPHLAYGPVYDQLIQEVGRDQLPEDVKPEAGQILIATGPDGQELRLVVKEVNELTIVVDGNHPLAGEQLIFEVELLEIL